MAVIKYWNGSEWLPTGSAGVGGGGGGGGSTGIIGTNVQTDNYTAQLTDVGVIVEVGATSAKAVTIPAQSAVAWPDGAVIGVRQVSTGPVAIVAGGGVSIRNSVTLAQQWAELSLHRRSEDEWVVVGGSLAEPTAIATVPSGWYSGGRLGNAAVASAAWIADRIFAWPFEIVPGRSIDRLGINVLSAVTSSSMWVGIADRNGPDGLPGTVLVATDQLSTAALGLVENTVALTFPSDRSWLWGIAQTGAIAGVTTRAGNVSQTRNMGSPDGNASLQRTLLYGTRTAAALPSSLDAQTWPTDPTGSQPPGIVVRYV